MWEHMEKCALECVVLLTYNSGYKFMNFVCVTCRGNKFHDSNVNAKKKRPKIN